MMAPLDFGEFVSDGFTKCLVGIEYRSVWRKMYHCLRGLHEF